MNEASRAGVLLPAAALVRDLPPLRLGAGEAARFRQGGAVPAPGMEDGAIAAFAGDDLLGVADVATGLAQPRRVVAAPPIASEEHG